MNEKLWLKTRAPRVIWGQCNEPYIQVYKYVRKNNQKESDIKLQKI